MSDAGDARIKFGLPHHPKVKKLQRRLGPGGPWGFVCLILWAGQNRPNGDLSGMDFEDVEIAACWDGEPGEFVRELEAVGLLDADDTGYELHDWADHQPWLAGSNERSERARKAALARHGQSGASGSGKRAPRTAESCDPQDSAVPDSAGRMRSAENGSAPSPNPEPKATPAPANGADAPARTADRFEEFWKCYPTKKGKKPAREAWMRKGLDARADQIIGDVQVRAGTDSDWLRGYVPNPLTYINQERWEDEIKRNAPQGAPKTVDNQQAVDSFLGWGSSLEGGD